MMIWRRAAFKCLGRSAESSDECWRLPVSMGHDWSVMVCWPYVDELDGSIGADVGWRIREGIRKMLIEYQSCH